MTRRFLLAVVVLGVTLVTASPVAAHDGVGVLVVESAQPSVAASSVDYVVNLTWENDGHAAVDATITATPIGAEGAPLTPVPLLPLAQEGLYGATVAFPQAGTWTVRLTSVSPAATVEMAQEIVAATTTTARPTTTTTASTTNTEAPTTTTTTAVALGRTGDGGNDDSFPWGIIAIALGAAAVGGGWLFFAQASRRPRQTA